MTCCVILHNMIIESEQEEPVFDTEPYYRQGPLAQVVHHLPAIWTAYLNMCQEIRDPQVHQELQHDLVEHLWRLEGDAGNDVWWNMSFYLLNYIICIEILVELFDFYWFFVMNYEGKNTLKHTEPRQTMW